MLYWWRKDQKGTSPRQYELLQMEDVKRVIDYFSRVLSLTNLMKGCNKHITDEMIIDKIMHTLTQNFDHIVVAIEEPKP